MRRDCRINGTTSGKLQTIGPGFKEPTKKHTITTARTAIRTRKRGAHYALAGSLGFLDGGNTIPHRGIVMPPLFFHIMVAFLHLTSSPSFRSQPSQLPTDRILLLELIALLPHHHRLLIEPVDPRPPAPRTFSAAPLRSHSPP